MGDGKADSAATVRADSCSVRCRRGHPHSVGRVMSHDLDDDDEDCGALPDSLRVILHLDNDAFYAAVEAKRLGVDPMEVPVGVVQWDGLIAVSYAARKFGVKRGDKSATARTK